MSLVFVGAGLIQADPGDKVYQQGYFSKEDSLKSIELQDGYSLQLVLSDPQVEEPVMVTWDGNGAMYVVQMNTYMQTLSAKGEKDAKSRITRHVDTNGDGVYDQFSIYADNLVLPRFVLPLDDRVIVGITDTLDLWTYRDIDNDGVADEKIKIYEGGRRGGNMEHQPSGLIWGLDNWMYLTYENIRYRFTEGKMETQKLPRGSGQWGIAQDDWGRLYFSDAGGEKPAIDYQQPFVYGSLRLKGEQEKDFGTVYPISQIPDVQGGPKRVGKNGGLNHFTGGGGQSIYRGDRLPKDLYGDLILNEPVGRLVRRAKISREDGMSVLSNAYPGSEFMRSRDVNFRPIWSATTPRGQMMFVDMHHGIIQQANWTKKGSYLRGVIEKWGLQNNIGKGRVYRLVHKDFKAGPQPKMLDETTKELVAHLDHPNGWWRDMAQRLIILREDRDSVIPDLEKMARENPSEYGRLHALWTLEGMGAVKASVVVNALRDRSSMVRTSAIRVAEPFLAEGNSELVTLLKKPFPKDIEMVLQMLNSLAASGAKDPVLVKLGEKLENDYRKSPVVSELIKARDVLAAEVARAAHQKEKGAKFSKSMEHGKTIYQQLCFSCHGENGEGAEMQGADGQRLAPPFKKSERVLGSGQSGIRVLLHGLEGPIEGEKYIGNMVAMANNDDQWVADVLTYIRNSFGNDAPMIDPATVAKLRKKHASKKTPWTVETLKEAEPQKLTYDRKWKLSASHNESSLKNAFDGDSGSKYSTDARMVDGMWVQVELPELTEISSIILDSRELKDDYPSSYILEVSKDGKNWGKPLAAGEGKSYLQMTFAPVEAKYIRITQNGKKRYFWAIGEMEILAESD
ncbi:MAG: DUF7133 domain-containing protein [Akkermansiaceae bacterium]